MAEAPKKNPIPGPLDIINWTTIVLLGAAKLAGKGIGAGIRAMRNVSQQSAAQRSIEILHDIMYDGAKHLPGSPRPPLRTHELTSAELKTFTDTANRLIDQDALPSDIASFARNFNIRLKERQ
jgi:hypothetical protein